MQLVWPRFTYNVTTAFCGKSYKSHFVDVETLITALHHLVSPSIMVLISQAESAPPSVKKKTF